MRNLLTSWVAVAGAALVTSGVAQFSHAAGFIVGGVALIGVAVSERRA